MAQLSAPIGSSRAQPWNSHGWLIAVAMLALSGCASYAARQIVRPEPMPKTQRSQFDTMACFVGFEDAHQDLTPGERVAYWYGVPRAYAMALPHIVRRGDSIAFHSDIGASLVLAPFVLPPHQPQRGSVILLPPWGVGGASLSPWAVWFAQSGYVVVMPDVPSKSSRGGVPVGYGPSEAKAVAALATQLRMAGALPDPVFLFGVSYGADVALFAAPQIHNLRGVIALEPFVNAAAAIRRAPRSGLFAPKWLGTFFGRRVMDAAIAQASRSLGVDLQDIDATDAVANSTTCTLIIDGGRDELMSVSDWQRLASASPRAHFIELPQEDHLSLPFRIDRFGEPLLRWMQEIAEDDTRCPTIVPMPPTLRVLQPHGPNSAVLHPAMRRAWCRNHPSMERHLRPGPPSPGVYGLAPVHLSRRCGAGRKVRRRGARDRAPAAPVQGCTVAAPTGVACTRRANGPRAPRGGGLLFGHFLLAAQEKVPRSAVAKRNQAVCECPLPQASRAIRYASDVIEHRGVAPSPCLSPNAVGGEGTKRDALSAAAVPG